MTEAKLLPAYRALSLAARRYGLRVADIKLPRRDNVTICAARDYAMLLLKERCGLSERKSAELMNCNRSAVGSSLARARREAARWASDHNARGSAYRRLTPAELARAAELNHRYGAGVRAIARELGVDDATLLRECRRAGIELKRGRPGCRPGSRQANRIGDPLGNAPLGSIPPGHPLYDVDQAMLRARSMKYRAEGGWLQSSIANIIG